MKKLVILTLALVTLCCLFVLPTAAYSDGELIWSEDFENAKAADYIDSYDNYDVVIENGKMNLLCFTGSKFYKLPIPADVAGLNKFTVVFDWEVESTLDPKNAGHTLYFAFGIKDADNANYVGYSHVNGTEHVGTIVSGTWARAYRTHYSEATTDKNIGKSLDATAATPKLRIKIEVDNGTTRVFVNGKREMLNETEDWRDMDKVGTLTYDGGMGFVSRGMGFSALIDYVAVYAGVDVSGIDDLAPADAAPAETTPAETTTAAPVETTTPAPVETTTPEPQVEETTPAPVETTPAPAPAKTTPADQVTEPATTGGCGSVVALGILACIIPAAVVVCKKRK